VSSVTLGGSLSFLRGRANRPDDARDCRVLEKYSTSPV